MLNDDLAIRRVEAVPRGIGMATSVYAEKALNSELWDVEGKRYIDFASGIAVVNTGHCHPKIVEAVTAQAKQFSHTCAQVVPYEIYVSLAERLNALVPGDFDKKTLFVTTGAEAVENAVKIAKAHTNRSGVIAFSGGFHGRTHYSMALTGKVQPYKGAFGPMVPDVFHVPFPIACHGGSVEASLETLHALLRSSIGPDRVAAIVIEPVQGEGGFNIVPSELMRALREICDAHGIVLIADEVQTGFARTGKLFAMEHYDVAADITTMAKGLGGGYPISAVTGRADIMDAPAAGGLGGTFGGSPIGLAAAHAVLDVIEEERLCDRSEHLGRSLEDFLHKQQEVLPQICDVRRLGFMVAAEFSDPDTGNPRADLVGEIRSEALDKGLILLGCGIYGNVIRFLAPLTISQEQFEEALDVLAEVMKKVSK